MNETIDTSKFSIENLLKISFPIIIMLGVVKLTSYYNTFNLSILQYLDFSEIITSFLTDLSLYLLLLAPFFFYTAFMQHSGWPSCLLGIIMFTLLITINQINGTFYYDYTKWVLGFTFVVITAFLWFVRMIKPFSLLFLSLSVFVILTLFVTIFGRYEAENVKALNIFEGTTVTINQTPIVSTSTFYFIGKSSKFIFYYDSQNKSCTIYPIDKVDEIIYKAKGLKFGGGEHPTERPNIP
jgi:hypothetical protein